MAAICGISAAPRWSAAEPSLKDAFAGKFCVGAALGTHQVMGDEAAALELVAEQFNSITPENLLKWQNIHPAAEQYNFEPADRFVDFGDQHGMFVVGHALVWHQQTPAWVFQGKSGQPLSRDALLARMQDHIATVVGRYKGRIDAWDVVNEAIDDDGNLRNTPWRRIIGDDYIAKAFQFAHQADPDAELYYNDYNEWHPKKRDAIARLVASLQQQGVPIAGLGLQGHWGLDYPSLEAIEEMFAAYRPLGVKLMVTELDMNVLPRPDNNFGADVSRNVALRKELNPYVDGLPDEAAAALANRYADIFQLFVKHADLVDRVTFWGVHNGHSWLNNWPIRGRTAYPLLFDRRLKPTAAYRAVLDVARP